MMVPSIYPLMYCFRGNEILTFIANVNKNKTFFIVIKMILLHTTTGVQISIQSIFLITGAGIRTISVGTHLFTARCTSSTLIYVC